MKSGSPVTMVIISMHFLCMLVQLHRETQCASTLTTYIIIPASNVMTQHAAAELTKVQKWAERHNLKLNCSKSTEVIRDHKRWRNHTAVAVQLAPMSGIACSSCLGIDIENNFSIAQHVQRLITASVQAVYALRVLRTCGLDDEWGHSAAHRATVIARLMYAASMWHGLPKAPDHKCIDSVLDRGCQRTVIWHSRCHNYHIRHRIIYEPRACGIGIAPLRVGRALHVRSGSIIDANSANQSITLLAAS